MAKVHTPSQVEALQAWWDAIPDALILEAHRELINSLTQDTPRKAFTNAKRHCVKLIKDFRAAPCPPEVQTARDYYADGWAALADATVDSEKRGFNSGSAVIAFQKIAIARGYCQALGVVMANKRTPRIFTSRA